MNFMFPLSKWNERHFCLGWLGHWGRGRVLYTADGRPQVYGAAAALEGVGHRDQEGKRFKNIQIIFHIFIFLTVVILM